MKKFLFFIFIFLNSFFLLLVSVLAVNYPNPTGFVNDYAGIYSSDFKIRLENKLKSFRGSAR